MTSREIIRRIVRRDAPVRIGWDFLDERYQDIAYFSPAILDNPKARKFAEWGYYPELKKKTGGFTGEMRMDTYGNIYGRYEGRTKGECLRGALHDGWAAFEKYRFPKVIEFIDEPAPDPDKYRIAGLPTAVFSVIRDMRHMDNALIDTIAEPEMVVEFLRRLVGLSVEIIDLAAKHGADAAFICDDWGTQTGPLVSPKCFRALFKPAYRAIADACHERGLDFILHSCGCVIDLVDDMIDAGIDAFQFDQPELAGSHVWAQRYGKRAAFYCPVDIQKVMATGNREYIEATALEMVTAFKENDDALIAKDYPSLSDIGVELEWAKWAMDVIVANSAL